MIDQSISPFSPVFLSDLNDTWFLGTHTAGAHGVMLVLCNIHAYSDPFPTLHVFFYIPYTTIIALLVPFLLHKSVQDTLRFQTNIPIHPLTIFNVIMILVVAQQMLNYSGHMLMYTLDDSNISC